MSTLAKEPLSWELVHATTLDLRIYGRGETPEGLAENAHWTVDSSWKFLVPLAMPVQRPTRGASATTQPPAPTWTDALQAIPREYRPEMMEEIGRTCESGDFESLIETLAGWEATGEIYTRQDELKELREAMADKTESKRWLRGKSG